MQVEYAYLANGERLAYRKSGNVKGPKLILLHGQLASSFFFLPMMQRMMDDYHLLAIDLRGCGESSYQRPIDSFAELAVDVEEMVKILNFADAYVLGWSFGGAVAMELAVRMQSLKGCILLASLGPDGYASLMHSQWKPQEYRAYTQRRELKREASALSYWYEAVQQQDDDQLRKIYLQWVVATHRVDESLLTQYVAEACKQRNVLDYELALLRFNVSHQFNGLTHGSGRIDAVECPILILHGIEDRVINPQSWFHMKADQRKNIQVKLFDKCGHVPQWDQQEAVMRAIYQFAS
ncbi:alpha/beta hydrolase (plasmid) [Entomospira entomophila]|uniref:Alpha/beta hydrolase n=1 Tax=Entomospira entomophila TaxID=2719988 RepID=A0A968GDH1_9SPIO|nr:alpha/beta hydrolase [Entomospira entomophilus]NIZ41456.1 alpha/beta hydrolase [Entomospira entomophilus]WDI36290.1 alpha/beta hydrolase [Entomospira entomophilus]